MVPRVQSSSVASRGESRADEGSVDVRSAMSSISRSKPCRHQYRYAGAAIDSASSASSCSTAQGSTARMLSGSASIRSRGGARPRRRCQRSCVRLRTYRYKRRHRVVVLAGLPQLFDGVVCAPSRACRSAAHRRGDHQRSPGCTRPEATVSPTRRRRCRCGTSPPRHRAASRRRRPASRDIRARSGSSRRSAPRDGATQCLLSCRSVDVVQAQVKRSIESLQQCMRRRQPDARCRKLGASGMPSRRRTMSATFCALSSVIVKSGRACRARLTKTWIAGTSPQQLHSRPSRAESAGATASPRAHHGRAARGDSYTALAPGADVSSRTTSRAAADTCSKLSGTSSSIG